MNRSSRFRTLWLAIAAVPLLFLAIASLQMRIDSKSSSIAQTRLRRSSMPEKSAWLVNADRIPTAASGGVPCATMITRITAIMDAIVAANTAALSVSQVDGPTPRGL